MTQEEKAKRYDETLERAKLSRLQLLDIGEEATEIEYIFPELKESEDEKIRKEIEYIVKTYRDSCIDEGSHNFDACLAWLEKQGEQKPADNLEPKFKVGDWITDGCVGGQITGIEDNYLCYKIADFVEGISTSIPFTLQDNYHLWTIQDAKDGDILWHSDTASNGIFIFKEIRHDGKVLCYCDYDSEDHFCTGEYHTCCWSHSKYIKPATKEQCALLYQKMHEAGYEWDEEKKELKKHLQWNISDYRTWQYIVSDVLTKHDGIGQYLDDGFCRKIAQDMQEEWSKKLSLGQNPAWGEDDEVKINRIVNHLENLNVADNDILLKDVDWLKSLKQRKEGTQ